MAGISSSETGITSTVNSFFSDYSILDIITIVTKKKSDAVLDWMKKNEVYPENCLIIGAYLTGAGLAESLVNESSVVVLDIYPHLKNIINSDVEFRNSFSSVSDERWDFIIDTTGFGGISTADILRIKTPGTFIAEDPCSDRRDDFLDRINGCKARVKAVNAPKSGFLRTSGLNSKTSGTMTLAIETVRKSMADALFVEGVLYSTSSLDFFERIMFKEKDVRKYFDSLEKNAMVVSSVTDVDCDEIINNNLIHLNSFVEDFRG